MTNLERSLKFYTELFCLKEVSRGDNSKIGGGIYVLLKDEKSGQKLELNFYSEGSRYGGSYIPGEGLDHVAFKVNNVDETLKELEAKGVDRIEIDPILSQPSGATFKVAYVKDPDGNWIELYHNPVPVGQIPEAY